MSSQSDIDRHGHYASKRRRLNSGSKSQADRSPARKSSQRTVEREPSIAESVPRGQSIDSLDELNDLQPAGPMVRSPNQSDRRSAPSPPIRRRTPTPPPKPAKPESDAEPSLSIWLKTLNPLLSRWLPQLESIGIDSVEILRLYDLETFDALLEDTTAGSSLKPDQLYLLPLIKRLVRPHVGTLS